MTYAIITVRNLPAIFLKSNSVTEITAFLTTRFLKHYGMFWEQIKTKHHNHWR
jgi:hypothetical protein